MQSLWASGDIIAEGVKKTYFAVANLGTQFVADISNWTSRSIAISNIADDATKSLFTGNGAQAAGDSKLDLVENGAYLATYGVDSARGEIVLSGSSQIVNGEARVFFDYSFSSIISDTTPIKLIVTPTSVMQGQLYTESKSQYGFVVKELNSADTGTFDWLVIARRRGFEDTDLSSTNQVSTFKDLNTASASASLTPEPTSIAIPSSGDVTASGSPDVAPTPTSDVSPTPEATPDATVNPTPEPTPDATVTPTPVPDITPAPTPTQDTTPIPTPELVI